jgi:hypothetical protein
MLMRLEGPAQEWQYGLPQGLRTDLLPRLHALPSKRFVLTLLCTVMGLGRHDPGQAPLFDLRLGVRADRPGRVEFGDAGRHVMVRDGSFLVALEHHERHVLAEVHEALRTPRRMPWLSGRVRPSAPLYVPGGLVDLGLTEALQTHPTLESPEARLTFVVEDGAFIPIHFAPQGGVVMDQPRWCVRSGPLEVRHVLTWRQPLVMPGARSAGAAVGSGTSGSVGLDPWDTWEEARPRRRS